MEERGALSLLIKCHVHQCSPMVSCIIICGINICDPSIYLLASKMALFQYSCVSSLYSMKYFWYLCWLFDIKYFWYFCKLTRVWSTFDTFVGSIGGATTSGEGPVLWKTCKISRICQQLRVKLFYRSFAKWKCKKIRVKNLGKVTSIFKK